MSLQKLPELDEPCGAHFTFRDFVECGETWESTGVENTPLQPGTYEALRLLAESVLDPVTKEFGRPTLTYGVACQALSSLIRHNIAPKLDQHAGYEMSAKAKRICDRGGVACDFEIPGTESLIVAKWIVRNVRFDRLYYYGKDRPIHVSANESPKGQCVLVKRDAASSKVVPTVISNDKFLEMKNSEGV